MDLSQDPFLVTREGSEFATQYKKAGLDEYGRTPLALNRETARDVYMDYFLSGSFTRDKDAYVLRYAVYRTDNGQPIAQNSARGAQLLPLIDEISVQLKRDLAVPADHIETTTDLPVAEIATASMPALRDYVLGTNIWWFHQDRPTAQKLLEQAVARDPHFALAYYHSAKFYAEGNQLGQARAALRAAKQNEYRLNERVRFKMNRLRFFLDKDIERQGQLLTQWTTLYPEDSAAWRYLWQFHDRQEHLGEAIAAAEQVRALDPGSYDDLLPLGFLYRKAGKLKEALTCFEQFGARFPGDIGAPLNIAELYKDNGEHEKARSCYERVLAMEPDNRIALQGECTLEIELGNAAQALAQCQRAVARSDAPWKRAYSYLDLGFYYSWRGMWRKALEQDRLGLAEMRKETPPNWADGNDLLNEILIAHMELGQTREARQLIQGARGRLPTGDEPASLKVRVMDIYYHVHTGDASGAAALIRDTAALFSGYGIADERRSYMTELQGELYERTGECRQALKLYAELPLSSWPPPWLMPAYRVLLHAGRCHRQLNQLKEAEANLKQGLVLWPSHPEIRYELALVYEKEGRLAEARQEVQAALRVWSDADPEYVKAREARELAARLAPYDR